MLGCHTSLQGRWNLPDSPVGLAASIRGIASHTDPPEQGHLCLHSPTQRGSAALSLLMCTTSRY